MMGMLKGESSEWKQILVPESKSVAEKACL